MKRIAYLSPYPYQKARSLTASKKFYIVTPTPQTARSLRVPHHSLEALAIQTLGKNGLAVAPALIASRILRGAAAEVISTADIEGTSRVFEPTLKELLQAGNWQQERNSSSPYTDSSYPLTPISIPLESSSRKRFEQLARLATTYRERLRQRNSIDPAEIFWQAAAVLPERRSQSLSVGESLLLYGYHFPRADELAFVDALAGDESILLLAGIDHPLFVENQKGLQWLKQKGWQVEVSDATPQSLGERAADMFLDSSSVAQLSSGEEVSLQKANPQDNPQDNLQDLPLAHTYPHLEAEVRGVLAQVKTLLSEQIAPNDIAIVARDENLYGPTILDIAWEYEVPVRALYAIPLKTTRFGAWVQALAETILAGLPFEQTLKVLAHPLCGGLAPEIWPQVRKLHPSSLQAWQDMGVDLSILSWPQKDTRANWVKRLQDVLSFWNLRRRASRWAREAVAYYKFLEGLVSLSEPAVEILSLVQFVEEISQLLSLSRVPAAPGRGGVELHAPISLTGACYRHVFVLGVAEGLLPAPVRQDPVLDFRDRQVLSEFGIPLAGVNTAGQEALSFWAVCLAASESLTLSYPRLIERSETLASPYLSQLGLKPAAAPPLPVASIESARKLSLRTSPGNKENKNNKQAKVVSAPLWQVRENKPTRVGSYLADSAANIAPWSGNKEIAPRSGKKGADGMPLDFADCQDKPDLQDKVLQDKVLPHAYHAWEVEQGRESSDLPDEYDGIIGIPLDPSEREFSASQLVNLGQCPFKWFADKILSLGELEEAEEELSPSLRGRLYHKTLELALKWAIGEKHSEGQLSEANLERDNLEVNLAAESQMAIAGYSNYTDWGDNNDTALTTQDLREKVLANLENAFLAAEKMEKLPALPAWEGSREEHLTVLRRTVLASDFLQEEAQVLSTEKKFQGEWYGLKVRGFVDRIDRTEEGLAIVDYKTSSTAPKGAKDMDGKAKLDIQLPLYVQVAAKEFISGGEQIANAYYYSLTKSKILKKADIDEEALAQFAERVKLQLETGHFPVEPDIDRVACRYCPYDLVCRQGTRLSRK
ncbi:MAG: hypothetical protein F6J93_01650 [Oscillatoria sp. SIO1A7]|nr:hypothetical protein [Oscillatoria sp. SIO1A7]